MKTAPRSLKSRHRENPISIGRDASSRPSIKSFIEQASGSAANPHGSRLFQPERQPLLLAAGCHAVLT